LCGFYEIVNVYALIQTKRNELFFFEGGTVPIAVLPYIRQWQEETNLAAADNRRVCVCGYRYGVSCFG